MNWYIFWDKTCAQVATAKRAEAVKRVGRLPKWSAIVPNMKELIMKPSQKAELAVETKVGPEPQAKSNVDTTEDVVDS